PSPVTGGAAPRRAAPTAIHCGTGDSHRRGGRLGSVPAVALRCLASPWPAPPVAARPTWPGSRRRLDPGVPRAPGPAARIARPAVSCPLPRRGGPPSPLPPTLAALVGGTRAAAACRRVLP